MNQWIQFFLGTPRRFLGTLVALGFATIVVYPEGFRALVDRVIFALSPAIAPLITAGIIWLLLRNILTSGKRKK